MSKDFDPRKLREDAHGIVKTLTTVAEERRRKFPPEIQAVLPLSGYGLYTKPLLDNQPAAGRWQDHDRTRAGVAIVSEVTSSRIQQPLDIERRSFHITKKQIRKHGPLFVYNGTPEQNENFLTSVNSLHSKIPPEKVHVIQTVKIGEEEIPIRHTGDQIQSLFQEVDTPESPLHEMTRIGVVTHTSQWVRVPYYIEKYNRERKADGKTPLEIWAYGVRNRPGTLEPLMEGELDRLVRYAEQGQLATEPATLHY